MTNYAISNLKPTTHLTSILIPMLKLHSFFLGNFLPDVVPIPTCKTKNISNVDTIVKEWKRRVKNWSGFIYITIDQKINQLYNQVSGHIVGYIGFLTKTMPNYVIAVKSNTQFHSRRIHDGSIQHTTHDNVGKFTMSTCSSHAPRHHVPPNNPPIPASSEAMKPQPQPAASQLSTSEWPVAKRQACGGEWARRRTDGRWRSTKGELYDLLFTIFIQSTHFIPFTYCSLEAATRAVGVDWEGGQAAAALEE